MFDINELPLRSDCDTNNKGSITKKSISSYKVAKGHDYYCSCRTYEQAYYVKSQLNKYGWDKQMLPKILDDYPIFYTKLLELYRYITRKGDKWWVLSIPANKSDNGLLQHITSSSLESLLHERDFLVKYDWDYYLLIDCIDDDANPYFERILPPYPERKIRNNRFRKAHIQELKLFQKLILENPDRTQLEISEITGISDMNMRNWLGTYGMDWLEFRSLVLSGVDDIFSVMKLQPIIFQPDLSPHKPNFKGYIQKNSRSEKNPYVIIHKKKKYGTYPNKEIAKKVRDELIKCDWDKSKLNSIRAKYGLTKGYGKDYIYQSNSGKYTVRKTINGRLCSFGCYDDYSFAEKVRDNLKQVNWDKSQLDGIIEKIC